LDRAEDRQGSPDSASVERPEDVAGAVHAALGALDLKPELAADATGLKRTEHGGCVRDRPFRREDDLGLGPIGGEPFLDLRPLFGSPHRRISIMAGR
jgi:hypothetical protein